MKLRTPARNRAFSPGPKVNALGARSGYRQHRSRCDIHNILQGWVRFAGYQVKMSAFLPANGLAGGSVFAAASALMAEGKRERREH